MPVTARCSCVDGTGSYFLSLKSMKTTDCTTHCTRFSAYGVDMRDIKNESPAPPLVRLGYVSEPSHISNFRKIGKGLRTNGLATA